MSVEANQSLVIGGNERSHWIIGSATPPPPPPPPGAAPALKKLSIYGYWNERAIASVVYYHSGGRR